MKRWIIGTVTAALVLGGVWLANPSDASARNYRKGFRSGPRVGLYIGGGNFYRGARFAPYRRSGFYNRGFNRGIGIRIGGNRGLRRGFRF